MFIKDNEKLYQLLAQISPLVQLFAIIIQSKSFISVDSSLALYVVFRVGYWKSKVFCPYSFAIVDVWCTSFSVRGMTPEI